MADRLTKAIKELQDFPGTWLPGGSRLRVSVALQVLLDASSKTEGHRVPKAAVEAVLRRLGVSQEPKVEDTPMMTPVAVSGGPTPSTKPQAKNPAKKMTPSKAAEAMRVKKAADAKKRASKPKVKLGHK